MFVENKEMYHINNSNLRKDAWTVGNIIDNTENYVSDLWNIGVNFNARVETVEGDYSAFYGIIDYYLKNVQDEQTYIRMLSEASKMLKSYSMLQREMVLEQIRNLYFDDLPSRKNSIYLCDNTQIEYWENKLKYDNRNPEIFKVSVTGDLFKSSEILLPEAATSINQMMIQARKYWEANLTDIDEKSFEYLFKGKVKVLEKIK